MQKYSRIILAVILLIYLLLVLPMITSGHNWGDDFASYLMQAISIVHKTVPEFIEANRFTILHSTITLGPVAYPWGFPLMIAPIYAVFGLNLFAIKMLNVLAYFSFLILLFFLFKDQLKPGERIIITCLFAFNPYILFAHESILSDLPFLLFSTLAIYLIERVYSAGRQPTTSWLLPALIGVSIFWSIFIRMNGFLLLATLFVVQIAWLIDYSSRQLQSSSDNDPDGFEAIPVEEARHAAIKRRFWHLRDGIRLSRQFLALFVLPYLIVGSLILLTSVWLPSGGNGYLDQASKVNLRTTFHHIILNSLVFNTFWHLKLFLSPLNIAITLITAPLALVGFISRARKDLVFAIYFLFTFFLYAIVPFLQGLRFLLPIMPIYIYFLFIGFDIVYRSLLQRFQFTDSWIPQILQVSLVLVLFAQSLFLSVRYHADLLTFEGAFDSTSTEMFHVIETRTSPDSVFIFFKPRAFRLITGRASFYSNNCNDLGLADYLVEHKKQTMLQLPSCEQKYRLKSIFENQRFIVFRVKPLD